MEKMNLFDTKEKPKRKTHSDNFKKLAIQLAKEIGISQAAIELGLSASSISSWKKAFNSAPFNSAPIQDSEGNLTFSIDGNTYTLNVNSEEERDYILARVNSISEHTWNWFKEITGKEHWVLYNTEMYELFYDDDDYINKPHILVEVFGTTLPSFHKEHLHYKENSNLVPIIPINATSCFYMFSNCNIPTGLNLTNFDTSQVVDMSGMFCSCSSLTTLDVTNFNTSQVTKMYHMFHSCRLLTTLDVTNFDTSKVTDMSYMFKECHSLTTLDLSNFNTSKVTKMSCMFSKCRSLASVNVTNFDTSKVTEMDDIFHGCVSLISIDLSNFATDNVIDMRCMFANCISLKTVKATDSELIKYIRENYSQIQIA